MSNEMELKPLKDTPAMQCFVCGKTLGPTVSHTTVEIDPHSETVGFRVAHLCVGCAEDVAKRAKKAGDDLNI